MARNVSSLKRISSADGPKPSGRTTERRSSNRPRFSAGWEKHFEAAQSRTGVSARAYDEIEVWTARPKSLLRRSSCLQVLDDADRTELGAINDYETRQSAIATRVLLRLALSRASRHLVHPGSWRFSRLDSGQLKLAEAFPQIRFSLSHCKSLIGVVVSPTFDVGLDLESVNFRVTASIKQMYLTNSERSYLSTLEAPQSVRGALRLWTLKEAFTKLTGIGIKDNFRDVEFQLSLDPVLTTAERFPFSSTFFESLYIDALDDLCLATLAVGSQSSCAEGRIRLFSMLENAAE